MIIEINKIDNLEYYLFALGVCSVSIQTALNCQNKALEGGFLEQDEREQCETIAYTMKRSLLAISDLLRMMGPRAEIDMEQVSERLRREAQKSES